MNLFVETKKELYQKSLRKKYSQTISFDAVQSNQLREQTATKRICLPRKTPVRSVELTWVINIITQLCAAWFRWNSVDCCPMGHRMPGMVKIHFWSNSRWRMVLKVVKLQWQHTHRPESQLRREMWNLKRVELQTVIQMKLQLLLSYM